MTYKSELIEKNTWRVDTADSFADVIAYVEKEPSRWPQAGCVSGKMGKSERDQRPGWYGTPSFAAAIKLARQGWRDGRTKMLANLDAARFIQTQANIKAEALDVAGAYPFVPAACAGDPMCMVSQGLEQSKTRPIFRFIVSLSVSADIGANVITNRGAAILSWIDKLENEGARCEIVFVMTTTARGEAKTKKFTIQFTAKRADEPLEIDRLAFIIAHASTLRRIYFALYETHADLIAGFDGSYGTPSDDIPPDAKVPHTVYFGKLHSGGQWTTLETAVAGVADAIAKMQNHEDLTLEDAA